jgi:hypothetical protein
MLNMYFLKSILKSLPLFLFSVFILIFCAVGRPSAALPCATMSFKLFFYAILFYFFTPIYPSSGNLRPPKALIFILFSAFTQFSCTSGAEVGAKSVAQGSGSGSRPVGLLLESVTVFIAT